MGKTIANIITGLRIACSVVMLLCPVFSISFCMLYLFGGATDMIDGAIARKTGGTSEFGARLDTVADFVFVIASLIKLLPIIRIPCWLWIWAIVIAVIKTGNVVWGFIGFGKLISLHTVLNRAAGLLLFLLPLTFGCIDMKYSFVVACSAATAAAIQESYYLTAGHDIL